jgi:hypothetical protein
MPKPKKKPAVAPTPLYPNEVWLLSGEMSYWMGQCITVPQTNALMNQHHRQLLLMTPEQRFDYIRKGQSIIKPRPYNA